MSQDKFHSRIQALFADIERLASDPQAEREGLRRELEALRARVIELEAQFLRSQAQQSGEPESDSARLVEAESASSASRPAPGRSVAPLLYEKEQVAYAFDGRRVEPLPPPEIGKLNIQPALQVPLVAGGEPIGAVLVEAPPEKPLPPEEASLAEAVARQVSLQIQNLRLLQAAERARAEAQAATRRFAHESWESFLDAIHQSERIGYVYDQSGVGPLTDPAPADADIQETVSVLDEHIGKVALKTDPARPLSEEDKALVSAVARQLAQQVENLRLLADAARARAEAEEATRRMAREAWQAYAKGKEEASLGFVYNANQVLPLTEPPADINLSKPLIVRGEPIGQLAVAGLSKVSPEMADLMDAIATQASLHLEALRLTEELQKRAAELQELDRLKSSFMANMSHELRTPLNSILGFADVILEGIDGPLTENMRNDLQLIQKNGQHLLHLINDVLDMAKIEAGRMNLSPETFRFHEILEEVTSITAPLASEKSLSLFIESDSDQEVEIFADRTRIRQVMLNLLNNALKFTEKGKISMRTTRTQEGILVTVRDTGIGIPPDKLEAIFQEFTQVDSSPTRKAGGTGLGLPISRKLVEMHGGRLWAESSGIPGEGSTFYLELPLIAHIEDTSGKKDK